MNIYVCVLNCVSLAVSECQRMLTCILSGHFDCFFYSPTSFFLSLPPPFFHNSWHLLIFICGLSYLWWDIELASPYFQSVIPHALPWQPNLPHSQKCVPFRICSLKYPPSTLLGLACLDCECVCVLACPVRVSSGGCVRVHLPPSPRISIIATPDIVCNRHCVHTRTGNGRGSGNALKHGKSLHTFSARGTWSFVMLRVHKVCTYYLSRMPPYCSCVLSQSI